MRLKILKEVLLFFLILFMAGCTWNPPFPPDKKDTHTVTAETMPNPELRNACRSCQRMDCFSCCPKPPVQVNPCQSPDHIICDLETKYGIQVIEVGDTLRFIIPADVYILRGTNLVDPNYSEVFRLITKLIQCLTPGACIMVVGHTDNVGTDFQKIRHSFVQARSVSAYLWSYGIPLSKMQVLGFDGFRQTASNKTMRGSAVNRRIEILVNYDINDI